MKIWEAKLVVGYCKSNELSMWFEFKESEYDNWVKEKDKNRYYRSEGWISEEIPLSIVVQVNNSLCVAKAEQGFDKDLSVDEQEALKEAMRDLIVTALDKKREQMLKTISSQIDFVINGVID